MTTLGYKHDAKCTQEREREREKEDAEKETRDEAHTLVLWDWNWGENQTCYWKVETALKYTKCIHVKQNMYIIRMNGKWPLVRCLILWSLCHRNLAIWGAHACAKTPPLTWLGMVPWYMHLKCPGLAAGMFVVTALKTCTNSDWCMSLASWWSAVLRWCPRPQEKTPLRHEV